MVWDFVCTSHQFSRNLEPKLAMISLQVILFLSLCTYIFAMVTITGVVSFFGKWASILVGLISSTIYMYTVCTQQQALLLYTLSVYLWKK
jgi:hypothetical protein